MLTDFTEDRDDEGVIVALSLLEMEVTSISQFLPTSQYDLVTRLWAAATLTLIHLFSHMTHSNTRSLFLLMPLMVLGLLSLPSHASAASGAYIPNVNDNTVSHINVRTNAVTATITVGDGPWAMARYGTGMFVTISNDDAVYVIDVTKDQVIRRITGAGDRPVGITINGTGAYVVNEFGGTVTLIDTTNFQIEKTITVGSSPIGIAISGTGAYVANSDSDTVSLIDITRNQVVRTISTDSFPWYIAINGTGAYVTDGHASKVTIIDTRTGNVARTIDVGSSPRGVTINGTGAYVANLGGDSVSVIDIRRNIVVKTISVGTAPIGIGSTGTGVFVSNYSSATVSIIDITNNVVERTVTVGNGAQHPGFFQDTVTSSSSSSSSSTGAGGSGVGSAVATLRKQNGLNQWGYPISSASSSSSSSTGENGNNSSTGNSSNSSSTSSGMNGSSSSDFSGMNSSNSSSNASEMTISSSSQNTETSSSMSAHEHINIVAQEGVALKDVWADDWFGMYVKKLMDLKIFEGYKDTKGKPLGLYGPADPITLGQLAKVGALLGQHPVSPVVGSAWATPYIAAAKAAKFTVFLSSVDANAPATRGAVIQTILEALGITIEASASVYSDVPASHPYAAAITTATKLGIVSGDDGKSTFRPNAPINRAEVAKMAVAAWELRQ